MSEWPARRILLEIADAPIRKQVALAFWKQGEDHARAVAIFQLAKALRFREQSLKSSPAEKKADLLLSRINSAEFHECFEMGLMLYHTSKKSDLLATFLDAWNIPHVNGSIETDDYKAPDRAAVEKAVSELRSRFDLRDILVYLASLGLLMGEGEREWREATWPVVDMLVPELASSVSA
jgi:hypothetical protein